jgi:hypothetical protein
VGGTMDEIRVKLCNSGFVMSEYNAEIQHIIVASR